MVIIFWTALVSAPISPSSFMILRFLVSHKAQCWSSSDNCCMASELYSSTSEQFLKESLNIHLGLVAKTVLIALPLPVIYLSVLGLILLFLIDFFFFFPSSGKLQVSSKWVWVSGSSSYRKNQESFRLLILGYLGACLHGLVVRQLPLSTVEVRHNSCALTAAVLGVTVGLWWEEPCVRAGSDILYRLLSKEIDFVAVLKCFCHRKAFSLLWKSKTWICWIYVLTFATQHSISNSGMELFMLEVWRSKWPCYNEKMVRLIWNLVLKAFWEVS